METQQSKVNKAGIGPVSKFAAQNEILSLDLQHRHKKAEYGAHP